MDRLLAIMEQVIGNRFGEGALMTTDEKDKGGTPSAIELKVPPQQNGLTEVSGG